MMRLLEALFGFEWRHNEQQASLKMNVSPEVKENTVVPPQYRDDVEKLRAYVGAANWKPGLEIKLELKELLAICPRERKRSDSYRKLMAYLDEELKIKLIIKKKKKR